MRRTFKAGDRIKHVPSGEEWIVACDEENGDVICCGWPETIAKWSDCVLEEAATPEGRRKLLEDVARSCAGQLRGSRASRQLLPESP